MPRRLLADARLARLAARGDQRAFEAIFERSHQELYRYCRAILRDSDDAQDALQGTMASALHSLPGEERRIVLRPWLYRVAHNEAISILRKRSEAPDSRGAPEPTTAGADSEAEARERLRSLVADLDRLPDRPRGALVMRELSGLGYAEIGAALTISPAAARQAVYEARVALRDMSKGREIDGETARRALSEGDGRRLAAAGCSPPVRLRFVQRIPGRDLPATLGPPGPVSASVSNRCVRPHDRRPRWHQQGRTCARRLAAWQAVTGGVGAGGMTGGMVAKGASVAVALAIGAGAAEMSGVVRMPVLDRNGPAVERGSATGRYARRRSRGPRPRWGRPVACEIHSQRARIRGSGQCGAPVERLGPAGPAGPAGSEVRARSDGLIASEGTACRRPRTGLHRPTLPRGATQRATGRPAAGAPGNSEAAPRGSRRFEPRKQRSGPGPQRLEPWPQRNLPRSQLVTDSRKQRSGPGPQLVTDPRKQRSGPGPRVARAPAGDPRRRTARRSGQAPVAPDNRCVPAFRSATGHISDAQRRAARSRKLDPTDHNRLWMPVCVSAGSRGGHERATRPATAMRATWRRSSARRCRRRTRQPSVPRTVNTRCATASTARRRRSRPN